MGHAALARTDNLIGGGQAAGCNDHVTTEGGTDEDEVRDSDWPCAAYG
jgi:hypothetical protein